MTFNRAKTVLLAAIGICLVISLFENHIQSYWLYVSYDIGVNIILAVSLNLINGYTGQFSLGRFYGRGRLHRGGRYKPV